MALNTSYRAFEVILLQYHICKGIFPFRARYLIYGLIFGNKWAMTHKGSGLLKQGPMSDPFFLAPFGTKGRFALHHQLKTGIAIGTALYNRPILSVTRL